MQKKEIGERLRLLRKEAGYSQQRVADEVGISDTSYQNYEYGKRDIPGDVLKKLASLYKTSTDTILGTKYGKTLRAIRPVTDQDMMDVPIYGTIAAGTPIEMLEIEDTFPISRSLLERLGGIDEEGEVTFFLLRVEGESMNRILPNGCYALIKPCSDIDRDNQPYAVCVNGYDATIKRVHKLANGFELVPDSTDPTFKPKVYDYGEPGTDKITVIGRVVYYVLPFDWGF